MCAMEFYLSNGEGPWAGVQGWVVQMDTYSWPYLQAQLWNQPSWEGSDLFHSGVVNGERRWAGPPVQSLYIGVYPGKQAGSLPPPSGGGGPWMLFVPISQTAVQCTVVLESVRSGGSLILLGEFMLAETVRPGGVWSGRIAPLIWTQVVSCCWASVLVTDRPSRTQCSGIKVNMCIWHQDTLSHTLMIELLLCHRIYWSLG